MSLREALNIALSKENQEASLRVWTRIIDMDSALESTVNLLSGHIERIIKVHKTLKAAGGSRSRMDGTEACTGNML